ncbi:hypothetical protein CYLTODRAFT_419354 [Cylindrobasidium torrendii FP15055 ss-10]|uniref:DUF6534 domain-containing protein n=1 Tax=Cylindrobasidium torrendii FP15055 ss-10 TaxID=1314674 RepID=A0A0D7BJW7_9AGAR|nr:hypothetical protein CYLTODRAFT_419354 [Cylindrobasidium torrendii FP15055 ss-10]
MASTHGPLADPDASAKALILYNGPLLIGTCIDWMLFGVLCIQIYYWIQTDRYKRRKRNVMLTIVILTTSFQTAQLGLVTATTWRILVQHWGNPTVWVHAPSEPAWNPPLDGMTALLVQWFFSWRIVVLSPHIASRIVVGVVFALSLIQCAGSWATGIMYYQSAGDFGALNALDTTVKLMIIASLSADIIIALTVCTLLYTVRRNTCFRSSAAMIDKLMANVIESGMITAIVVFVELIMYLNYQHSALFTIL